ncbi:putative myosin regulatory light chain [Trichinella nelsoni]|uniref:Putative myosin regulatory light chain n=1 Tax=Trichinella nelsoni TaxID=6336 RepID=A0A0V0RZW0_9BILA|nr:putative myosin regulatory light chain [Trichinella nelsoni]
MRSTVASVKSKERKEAKFPIHHETSKRNLRPQRSLPLVGDIQQAKNSMRALSRDGPPTAHVVPRPSLPFHYGSSNGLNCAFMNSIPAVSTAADAYKAELRFGLAASTPSLCQMQNFYGSSNRLNFELPPPSISYNPVTGANVVHAASVSCLDAQRRVELLESKVGYLESLIPKQADGDLHYGQASTRPPVQHPSVRGTWCRAPFHSEYDRPAHGEDAMCIASRIGKRLPNPRTRIERFLKERQLSTVNSQMRLMNLEKNSLLACMQSLEMKQELERSTYSIHEAEVEEDVDDDDDDDQHDKHNGKKEETTKSDKDNDDGNEKRKTWNQTEEKNSFQLSQLNRKNNRSDLKGQPHFWADRYHQLKLKFKEKMNENYKELKSARSEIDLLKAELKILDAELQLCTDKSFQDGKFGNTKGEYLLPQKCFKDIKQCRKMTEQLVKVYKSIADNDQPDLDALLGIDTDMQIFVEKKNSKNEEFAEKTTDWPAVVEEMKNNLQSLFSLTCEIYAMKVANSLGTSKMRCVQSPSKLSENLSLSYAVKTVRLKVISRRLNSAAGEGVKELPDKLNIQPLSKSFVSSGKIVQISKAMAAYLKSASDRKIKMDIEIEKYELGKRHLANMMGFDADAITKEDIDNAIRYLFPSGLFSLKSRPVMKHPDELFPRVKSAEFDTDGRPFHFLFYTLNASFYQIMFDCAEKTDVLQRYEDTQLRQGKFSSEEAHFDTTGTEWISREQLQTMLSENVSEVQYERFLSAMNHLTDQSYSLREKDFIMKFRRRMCDEATTLLTVSTPEILYDEWNRKYAVAVGKRRKHSATVKLYANGTGKFSVDNLELCDFFSQESRAVMLTPFLTAECLGMYDVIAETTGGGESTKAGAVRHGIALALCAFVSEETKMKLRLNGLLTWDRRRHERKKVAQPGARQSVDAPVLKRRREEVHVCCSYWNFKICYPYASCFINQLVEMGKQFVSGDCLQQGMASRVNRKGLNRKRFQRATSNIFAMFSQAQIQEFKEAFNMIDQNRDGFIDKEDLHDMFASLGKDVSDDILDSMINESPGTINFTVFLTLFGEKMTGTDPEEVIRNAFQCFDEEGTGYIKEEYLRELLTTMGDRYTNEQVDELFKDAPIKNNFFNYVEFARMLKHGAVDKDD